MKWEGFGAVLRNHAGSPFETFMAIPTGAPDGFRAFPNEGAFHLYAKGAPLCLRFGARVALVWPSAAKPGPG